MKTKIKTNILKIKKTMLNILLTLIISISFSINASAADANDTDLKLLTVVNDEESLILDVFVINNLQNPISSVQSWLSFDTSVLKCADVDTRDSDFELLAPGEGKCEGEKVSIGMSTLSDGLTSEKIFVARVEFEKLSLRSTEISFDNFNLDDNSNVSIRTFQDGFPVNVLTEKPESFKLSYEGGDEELLDIIQNDNLDDNILYEEEVGYDYNIIIPENLHLTSEDNYVVIKWNPVKDAIGYNVYYSQRSGRYIQRSMIENNPEFYIDGLNGGALYFFAVKAVFVNGEESEYSNEVAVQIGDAFTASSPLYLASSIDPVSKTKSHVNTGMNTIYFSLFLSFLFMFLFIYTKHFTRSIKFT